MSDTVQSLKAAPLLASVGAQLGLQAGDIQFLISHVSFSLIFKISWSVLAISAETSGLKRFSYFSLIVTLLLMKLH